MNDDEKKKAPSKASTKKKATEKQSDRLRDFTVALKLKETRVVTVTASNTKEAEHIAESSNEGFYAVSVSECK